MSILIKKLFSTLVVIIATSIFLFPFDLYADVISNNVSPDIQEPVGTYDQPGGLNIVNMTLDTVISAGACVTGDYQGCTLNDVLNDINSRDDFKPEIKVHMTADDFPDDGKISNATLRQRGATTRSAAQKSFRIKIDSKKNLWRNERRIQLIKSPYDSTRIRNKISYDLFTEIPHLPSMRTQFTHLFINDQNSIEDYGLYTHVESFHKEYLQRRGWDKDSRVYKVGFYAYYPSSDLTLNADGTPADINAFETKLEIKRGDTHFDLINMINDLNDPGKDFNTEIMGKYFNRDNYLTWFAVNILLNNTDTTDQNHYLFNPKGTEHFYFVPWDYDGSLGQYYEDNLTLINDLPRWWYTHGNWWDIYLHKRFLREPGNLQLLKNAVQEIKNKYLTTDNIRAKADSYRDLIFPVLKQQTDWNHLGLDGDTDPEKLAAYNSVIDALVNSVELSYTTFMQRANDPMPFYMNEPVFLSNNNILFTWDRSESLTGQSIVYDLEIASTKEFQAGTILESITNLAERQHTLHWTHSNGVYYYRVRSRDIANPQSWQEAANYDYNLTHDGSWLPIYGVKKMVIAGGGPAVIANDDNATVQIGNTIVIDALANDTGTGISISEVDAVWTGSVSIVNGKLEYIASGTYIGNVNVYYGIIDSAGNSDWAKVVINITQGGTTLSANDDSATVKPGDTVLIDVLANDTGTGINISEVDAVWTGSVSIVNGKLEYIASGTYTGNVDVYYDVIDSAGNYDWAKVVINITQGGTTLSANDDSATVKPGDTVLIDVLANDTGTGISISEVDDVWTGSVSIVNGKIEYIASGTYTGKVDVYYGIIDSSGDIDWAKVIVNITQGGTTLSANDDSATVKLGDTVLIDALANDTGTGISISEVDDVWTGSVSIVNGKIEYIANGIATSNVDIYYGIIDSSGDIDWAKVAVKVTQ